MGLTQKRKLAEKQILDDAKRQGTIVEKVVLNILVNGQDQLRRYVLSKNETPLENIKQLIVQASLLRYAEIHDLSQKRGTTEDDALEQLETQDDEHLYNGSTDFVLSADISAALNKILDQKRGFNLRSVGSVINKGRRFNGFSITDPEPWLGGDYGGDPTAPAPTTGGTNWGTVGGIAGAAGSIFDLFNKVVDGINKTKNAATGAIGSVGGAVQTQFDKYGNVVSDIGGDSITKALKDNLPYILAILGAIVLIIVMAIYANKSK